MTDKTDKTIRIGISDSIPFDKQDVIRKSLVSVLLDFDIIEKDRAAGWDSYDYGFTMDSDYAENVVCLIKNGRDIPQDGCYDVWPEFFPIKMRLKHFIKEVENRYMQELIKKKDI